MNAAEFIVYVKDWLYLPLNHLSLSEEYKFVEILGSTEKKYFSFVKRKIHTHTPDWEYLFCLFCLLFLVGLRVCIVIVRETMNILTLVRKINELHLFC